MAYKVGDIVVMKSFKREAAVLEILPGGLYRISLGNLPLTVKEEELSLAQKPSTAQKNKKKEVTVQSTIRQGDEKENLDLHGLTVADAIEALEAKLNRAVLSNLHRIKVVHGLGSGRVKEGVHSYLSTSTMISAYKVDEYNPGVTWVYL